MPEPTGQAGGGFIRSAAASLPPPPKMRAADQHDLLRRHEATRATLEKYRGKGWSWEAGRTCVHMARSHLVKMGHKPEALPRIRSLLAARRALAQLPPLVKG